jgi:hypothetical protein
MMMVMIVGSVVSSESAYVWEIPRDKKSTRVGTGVSYINSMSKMCYKKEKSQD